MSEIKLLPYQEIEEEILKLHRVVFGPSRVSRDTLNWMYNQNPFQPPESGIVVAIEGGEIVGARPFVFCELWLKNKRVRVAQPSGTAVHPDHRRKGIFSRMNGYAIDYLKRNGYFLCYNFPGPMSKPGYLKQGWKLVGKIYPLITILDASQLLSSLTGSKIMGLPLGLFYNIWESIRSKGTTFELLNSLTFAHFVEKLRGVETLKDETSITLVRDATFLKWRFDQHPTHKYKYILIPEDDKIYGYAVIRSTGGRRGFKIGYVIDFAVRRENLEYFLPLIKCCLDEFVRENCAYVSIWEPAVPSFREGLTKHFGFKSARNFPYNRYISGRDLVVRGIDETTMRAGNIYERKKWDITYAFLDSM